MPINETSDQPSHDESSARGMIPAEQMNLRNGINWKVWIPVLLLIVIFPVAWMVGRDARAKKLHAQLETEHKRLTGGLAPEYMGMRSKIERLAFKSTEAFDKPFTAPGFNYETLARTSVLYGRIRQGEVHAVGEVEASIRHRYHDQVAACLGVNAVWVPEFYRRGDFITPAWLQSVGTVNDADRLAALRADLTDRVKRDWPELVEWTRRTLLIIAVDEAEVSYLGPTRVYVWDLATESLLASSRGDGTGTAIVPVNIAGASEPGKTVPQDFNVSVHDCAVANVMRAQLGVQSLGSIPGR